MKKDSLKVCLKKFNIHLHDNLVLSSNLTYNFVKNVQTLNFTQFYLYFNGKFPIISDQIIQFVHQNKSEFDSINIFMSPLDINISFEELPIVYNYFMKIKSKFQNLEKIFCIYFNLTKFSVNFGVKSNNSIYETIKLNSVLSHIKGTLENGQIKYDFTSSLKIIGFSSKFSQFVPIINNLDINFLIFVSKSEINFEIKTNSDLKSILTVEFINLLNNIKDYHDLQSDKKIFIENQSISKIILNNNLNLIINPNQTINDNEKTIQFGSSVLLLPTNMFFDGFQISKNLILQIDSSFEGNYYRILPKMTIHNSLPVSFSVFSANRNLIFNLSPNEEKILETNCFIIAENSSSAKASEKIIINEKRKIFSNLISQNVQKSIVIDISDSSVNVLPRLVVVNEIGHPFFVKLSSANLIIEKKVEERENIMLPYYEQLPIHASINFSDGFSNEFKIGEIFKVKISSEYINIASKLRVNDNGQTEIVFYPQFSFINRGISEIFIHYKNKTYKLDRSDNKNLPLYVKDGNSCVISPKESEITVNNYTDLVDLQIGYEGLMKFSLKNYQSLYYILYAHVSHENCIFDDAILLENFSDFTISAFVDQMFEFEIKSGQSHLIHIVKERYSFNVKMEGFKNDIEISIEYPSISNFIFIKNEKEYKIVNVVIEKNDKGFKVILQNSKKSIFLLLMN